MVTEFECQECSNPATHILVDYMHNVVNSGMFYCHEHAPGAGLFCPCCGGYEIYFNDHSFLPVYTELDSERCCSDHP